MKFEVKKIDKITAVMFIEKYHYSPVMPALTTHYLGFFLKDELSGVMTLGWGTRPRHTIAKILPTLKDELFELNVPNVRSSGYKHSLTNYYFEIGKMCLLPKLNGTKSYGSCMISSSIRWIKRNTNCKYLYTMADGIMGKCGYVYQASNFYFGERYWTDVYMMENGEKLHPRSSKDLCKENVEWERRNDDMFKKDKLSWLTTGFMKERGIRRYKGYMFRYIYPLDKRSAKILLKLSSMNWTKNYPKKDKLQWKDVTDLKDVIIINESDKSRPDFEMGVDNIKHNNITSSTSTVLDDFFLT